jgi:dTDP-4-amino-4,6-dideoxygalactose transaminase
MFRQLLYWKNQLGTILINADLAGGVTKEQLMDALAADNIECRPLWKPMHLQPVFEGSPYYGAGVSEMLFKNGLCLPSGSNLSMADLERVVTGILNCFN